MHTRLGFVAFVFYVALDLSNPFVAGAFNFNPDECVEATPTQLPEETPTVPLPPAAAIEALLEPSE